jgi:hypothetical protein
MKIKESTYNLTMEADLDKLTVADQKSKSLELFKRTYSLTYL